MQLRNLLLATAASTSTIVPQPNGQYGVSLTDLEFVDTGRTDPYTGTLVRKLPISIISPTSFSADCKPIQQMYMPKATAIYWEAHFKATYNLPLSNTFSRVALSLCNPRPFMKTYPLVLFSPGLGISRQFYHILLTNIAAQGYTVVSIDHPGQTNFQEFMDGSVEYGANISETDKALTSAVNVRVDDIQFVLDELASNGYHYPAHKSRLDTSSVAIFGHSFGGAAALSSIVTDPRFLGGANLDGAVYGAPLTQNISNPFLFFARDIPSPHTQSSDSSWATSWHNLKGPKWQFKIKESAHGTYQDLAVLAQALGADRLPGVDQLVGSINATEALEIQVSVLSTLFEYIYAKKGVESVSDVAKSFPQIVIANATNVGL